VEQAVSVSTCHHGIESLTNSNVCPPVEMTYIDQPHRHWHTSVQLSIQRLAANYNQHQATFRMTTTLHRLGRDGEATYCGSPSSNIAAQ